MPVTHTRNFLPQTESNVFLQLIVENDSGGNVGNVFKGDETMVTLFLWWCLLFRQKNHLALHADAFTFFVSDSLHWKILKSKT